LVGVVGFYLHSPVILLISIFLAGIASTFFGPVKFSIMPDHLENDELIVANGLIEAGTFMAILFGIIAGGVFISSEHLNFTALASSMIGVSIIGLLSSYYIPKTDVAEDKEKIDFDIITETKKCIDYAKNDNDTFLAILGISWFWLIGGVFMSQMPNFTRYSLNGDPSVLIMLLTIFSVGTAMGSMFCDKLLKGRIDTQYVPISIMLMTVFVFLLWYTSLFFDSKNSLSGIHYFLSSLKGLAVCVYIFFIAFFGGIYIVPLYAFMQVRAKKSHRSRIIAANNTLNAKFIFPASYVAM
jgi:acyl-[acyl-carrier-protein]-phospholipid O-acyltransferase/long-chain-fatty-acid--[acyl-carrier-protein] ligase